MNEYIICQLKQQKLTNESPRTHYTSICECWNFCFGLITTHVTNNTLDSNSS